MKQCLQETARFKKASGVKALSECQARDSTSGPGTCPLQTTVPWDHAPTQVCLSRTVGTRGLPSVKLTKPLRSDKTAPCALGDTTPCSRPRTSGPIPGCPVSAALPGPSARPDVMQGKGRSTGTCHLQAAPTLHRRLHTGSNQHQPTVKPTGLERFLRRDLYVFLRKF